MTTFWLPSSPTRILHLLRRSGCLLLLGPLLCSAAAGPAPAQAKEDVLSQREVDDLRDAAFVPLDRLRVFEQILDDRQRQIVTLLSRRRSHTDFAGDAHDLLDQFGGITDELNDNLDEWNHQHRDIRKGLPKLLTEIDHWSATLHTLPEADAYNVVRRIAVDNLADSHEIVTTLQSDLDTYFKLHPEAAKEEQRRNGNPHAARNTD